jgi:hypothetical protein
MDVYIYISLDKREYACVWILDLIDLHIYIYVCVCVCVCN